MKNSKINFSIALLIVFLILLNIDLRASDRKENLSNKIAFLRDGEVWLCNLNAQQVMQYTNTNNKIEQFAFSPSLRYLAYSRIDAFAKIYTPDDTYFNEPVYTIVIEDLLDDNKLIELKPESEDYLRLKGWTESEKLMLYDCSPFDIASKLIYDPKTGEKKETKYVEQFDYAKGIGLYVDDTGVGARFQHNLHVINTETKEDTIILSKRYISYAQLSHNKLNIAFLEGQHLWICDITGNSLSKLHSVPSGSSSSCGVKWSLNDKWVGIFHIPVGIVVNLEKPEEIQEIKGYDFTWIKGERILVIKSHDDIYLYDPKSKDDKKFLDNALQPVYLD